MSTRVYLGNIANLLTEAKTRFSLKTCLYQVAHVATLLSFIDQNQFSSSGIDTLSSRYVERIKTIIKLKQILDRLLNSQN